MRFTNCELREIYVVLDGEEYDLHNCYDFVGLEYLVLRQTLTLRWVPGAYAGKRESLPLTLVLEGVTHFAATPRDPSMSFNEDDCLHSFGWKGAESGGLEVPLLGDPVPEDAIYTVSFMSGLNLEVRAATATAQLG